MIEKIDQYELFNRLYLATAWVYPDCIPSDISLPHVDGS